jgi:hypothetical protein
MEYVNDIFVEFSGSFAGQVPVRDEIVLSERLKRNQLDYSLESLKLVDEYLLCLYENRPNELGDAWGRTILWAGAYVGEVIRRNAPRQYDWTDFDEFVKQYPNTKQILGDKRELGATAILAFANGGFTLPINKALKFVYSGPEESTWFYASCEFRQL